MDATQLDKEYIEQVLVHSIRFYKNGAVRCYDESLFCTINRSLQALADIDFAHRSKYIHELSTQMAASCGAKMERLKDELRQLKWAGHSDANWRQSLGNHSVSSYLDGALVRVRSIHRRFEKVVPRELAQS